MNSPLKQANTKNGSTKEDTQKVPTHLDIIIKAREFARQKHQGTFRKYSDDTIPYFVHPERIAVEVLKRPDSTSEMVAAAYLHDTIEDTGTTHEELMAEFGYKTADYVLALTSRSKQISMSGIRSIRKKIDHEYLGEQCKEVKVLKLLDRLDNLQDLSHCPDNGFVWLYHHETKNLLAYISDADQTLHQKIIREIWFEGNIRGFNY